MCAGLAEQLEARVWLPTKQRSLVVAAAESGCEVCHRLLLRTVATPSGALIQVVDMGQLNPRAVLASFMPTGKPIIAWKPSGWMYNPRKRVTDATLRRLPCTPETFLRLRHCVSVEMIAKTVHVLGKLSVLLQARCSHWLYITYLFPGSHATLLGMLLWVLQRRFMYQLSSSNTIQIFICLPHDFKGVVFYTTVNICLCFTLFIPSIVCVAMSQLSSVWRLCNFRAIFPQFHYLKLLRTEGSSSNLRRVATLRVMKEKILNIPNFLPLKWLRILHPLPHIVRANELAFLLIFSLKELLTVSTVVSVS